MASVATALYVNALSFCLLLGCHHISAQNVTAAPIKRGGGWGWKAVDVSGELKAMPVQWWYNWCELQAELPHCSTHLVLMKTLIS